MSNNFKSEAAGIYIFGFTVFMFGLGYFVGTIQNDNSWNNGVLEGRCLERGGTIYNVDGSLKCVINNNLE